MKRYLFIILSFAIIVTLLAIVDTFALFETNGTSTAELEIGKWHIELNGEDISLEDEITLDDFTYSQSSHTDSGYFAPGMSALFDIEIDASLSDVSVSYDLLIDDSILEDYENIYFSIKNMDTNQEINSNSYSGVINLNDLNRTVNLRISLIWEDDSDYDESDTSLIGEDLEFVINADFKQYLGE